jgi:hypothetical protein
MKTLSSTSTGDKMNATTARFGVTHAKIVSCGSLRDTIYILSNSATLFYCVLTAVIIVTCQFCVTLLLRFRKFGEVNCIKLQYMRLNIVN